MTIVDFIGSVGGLFGLCLGFSLISFFELLYWFLVRTARGSLSSLSSLFLSWLNLKPMLKGLKTLPKAFFLSHSLFLSYSLVQMEKFKAWDEKTESTKHSCFRHRGDRESCSAIGPFGRQVHVPCVFLCGADDVSEPAAPAAEEVFRSSEALP